MKALILDAHASSAVAAVQSLGKCGIEVHAAAAEHAIAFGSRYAARRILYPDRSEPSALIEWVRTLDARECYGLIVPSTERSIRAFQHCGDADPLRQKAVLAPHDSVEIALDKIRTVDLAATLGIPVPVSTMIDSAQPAPTLDAYPLVLKTATSQVLCGGSLVYAPVCIATNPEQRAAFLENWLPSTRVQQQRYVGGHGWGVECLYAHGELLWVFAHERLHEFPLTGGAGTYRRSVEIPPRLLQCAKSLLDALSWHGVAMVEFRMNDAGEFALLEINPRLWGSLPLAVSAGVDFPLGLWRLAIGEPVGGQPPYRKSRYMRNLVTDLDWMKENLIADHSDDLLLTRSRMLSVLEWGRPLLGLESWDHFDWRDPGPTTQQLALVYRRLARLLRSHFQDGFERVRLRRVHRRNMRRYLGRRPPGRRLVFVCHGNICRSPFAERLASVRLPGWQVESSGVHEEVGRRTPEHIQAITRQLGVDLEAHRSATLTPGQAAAADLLIVMDTANYREVARLVPFAAHKIVLLGMCCAPRRTDIPDPLNLDSARARESYAMIADAVDRLCARLGVLRNDRG